MSVAVAEETNIPLIRLVQFAQLRIVPVMKDAAADEGGVIRRYRLGELLEVVWWLIQGVDTGYFPLKESTAVWRRHAGVIAGSFQEYVDSGYGFFAPRLIYDLQQRLAEGTIFTAQPQSNGTDMVVDQGIAISNAFSEDTLARRCLATLLFAPRETWEQVTGERPTPEQVDDILSGADSESDRVSLAAITAGWVRVMEHMSASRAHFAYEPYGSAFRLLMPQYGQIEAWRLNFNDDRFSLRSDFVTEKLAGFIAKGLDAKLTLQVADSFSEAIQILKRDWTRNHPFFRTGEAGQSRSASR